MNYRHAFHAGNFADVLKHAVLARILVHLAEKPAAFRVIDTHAGAGLYDLSGAEAQRTGECREGIGRLTGARLSPAVRDLLAPYLRALSAFNAGEIVNYPGSPLIACSLMRPQDRLVACELEPNAARSLSENLRRDARAKALAIDAWTALNAYVPPKERRGVVLIDPAFEQPDEFERLAAALGGAYRKWRTGIYLVWFPIKNRNASGDFLRRIAESGIHKVLTVELQVAPPDAERLTACGLLVINPPWRLEDELKTLLPALASAVSAGNGRFRLDWLAGEK
jgi:23S rRNA (adenine2030-N6)-methyltransferase